MTDFQLPARLDGEPCNVAVVGSRQYPNLPEVVGFVANLPEGTTIISGGAHGVDSMAEEAARATGKRVVVFKPKWQQYGGLKAPLMRNHQIAVACDVMVAFWDGKSTGTQHALGLARKLGKPTHVFTPTGGASQG